MNWTQRHNGSINYCAANNNISVQGSITEGVEGYPMPITSGTILIKGGANAGVWTIKAGAWDKMATPKYAQVTRGSAAGPYYLPEAMYT